MKNADIKKIQKNVAGSLAVENAYPSEYSVKVNKEYLKGNISSEKAVKK